MKLNSYLAVVAAFVLTASHAYGQFSLSRQQVIETYEQPFAEALPADAVYAYEFQLFASACADSNLSFQPSDVEVLTELLGQRFAHLTEAEKNTGWSMVAGMEMEMPEGFEVGCPYYYDAAATIFPDSFSSPKKQRPF